MQRFTGLGQPLYIIPVRFWEGEPIPCMLVSMGSPWDQDRRFYVWHMGCGSDVYVSAQDLFTSRSAAQEEIRVRIHQKQIDDEARRVLLFQGLVPRARFHHVEL